MKKAIITFGFIGMFALYSLYQYFGMSGNISYAAPTSQTSTTQTTPSQPVIPPKKTVATLTTTPPSTPAPVAKKGLYADGTYTGNAADAYYGNIQVQVTISNSKITDVQFLQAPNDRSTSRQINSQADPILRAEAISMQSANVDFVSGASDTSQAFQQSLKSALLQAENG